MAGRRIDDHSGFPGKGDKNHPLPSGCRSKYMDSAEGAGELKEFQDTAPKVEALQDANIRKMKKHAQPAMKRN